MREEYAVRPFTFLAVLLLAVVSVFQLARFVLGWPVSINGLDIPVWVSALVGALTLFLAVMLAREAQP
jgi:hypothetical protein